MREKTVLLQSIVRLEASTPQINFSSMLSIPEGEDPLNMKSLKDLIKRNQWWNRECAKRVERDRDLSKFFKKLIERHGKIPSEAYSDLRYLSLVDVNYNGVLIRTEMRRELDVQIP